MPQSHLKARLAILNIANRRYGLISSSRYMRRLVSNEIEMNCRLQYMHIMNLTVFHCVELIENIFKVPVKFAVTFFAFTFSTREITYLLIKKCVSCKSVKRINTFVCTGKFMENFIQ